MGRALQTDPHRSLTEFITALANELPDAHALPCDVADRDAWGATLRRIRDEFGPPTRILINTEAAAWGEYNALSLDSWTRAST